MHIPDFISIIEAIIKILSNLPFSQRRELKSMISGVIEKGDKEAVKSLLTSVHLALQQDAEKE